MICEFFFMLSYDKTSGPILSIYQVLHHTYKWYFWYGIFNTYIFCNNEKNAWIQSFFLLNNCMEWPPYHCIHKNLQILQILPPSQNSYFPCSSVMCLKLNMYFLSSHTLPGCLSNLMSTLSFLLYEYEKIHLIQKLSNYKNTRKM